MPIVSNFSLDQLEPATRGTADHAHAQLLRRAALLLPRERLLIDLVLRKHLSRRQVAQIMQMEPGTLTRRLQRLARRLHDPLVIALTDHACPLPDDYRQLGIEHFLQGQPIPDLADHHRMTRPRVRQILAYVRGWHRGRVQESGSRRATSC